MFRNKKPIIYTFSLIYIQAEIEVCQIQPPPAPPFEGGENTPFAVMVCLFVNILDF
jgi:hypothetical protein